MKKLLFLLICAFGVQLAIGQNSGSEFDLTYLKTRVAEKNKVPTSAVSSLEVRNYDKQSFVVARLLKDGKPNTFVNELSHLPGGPDFPFIGGSITCTGFGCAECDVEGLPKIENIWCNCVRRVAEGGYCNMTKTIGVGN